MKRRYFAVAVLILVIVILGAVAWATYVNPPSPMKHETDRWAVIEDINGDIIAVEPVSDDVWSELVQLNQNGTEMWIGGILERYSNKWGFRFKPENITIAEVTAEGSQSTIGGISEDLDYWLNYGVAFVFASVTEIHSNTCSY